MQGSPAVHGCSSFDNRKRGSALLDANHFCFVSGVLWGWEKVVGEG